MKPYKPLIGYLERFTVFKWWKLHIRIHYIKRADITPFQHSHPFHYISVILSGGYTEQVGDKVLSHVRGGVIIRTACTSHKIVKVLPNTKTLFITWSTKDNKWQFSHEMPPNAEWVDYPVGVYSRVLYGVNKFCKFDQYWYKSADTMEDAIVERDPSIDQNTVGNLIKLLT